MYGFVWYVFCGGEGRRRVRVRVSSFLLPGTGSSLKVPKDKRYSSIKDFFTEARSRD